MSIFKFALREDLKDHKEFLPSKAHDTDTGFDVRAAQLDREPIELRPFQKFKIPLGIRGFLPENYWYKLVPRSSTFWKKDLNCLYGTIDNSFENELCMVGMYIPEFVYDPFFEDGWKINQMMGDTFRKTLTINFGDAIGQIIPEKINKIDIEEINNETYNQLCAERNGTRGIGGFGSSGQ